MRYSKIDFKPFDECKHINDKVSMKVGFVLQFLFAMKSFKLSSN